MNTTVVPITISTIMFTFGSFVSWRRLRRAAHEALTKRALQDYHPIHMKEATILVSSLLTPSANLKQDGHFKRLAASSIMSIVYDYPTITSDISKLWAIYTGLLQSIAVLCRCCSGL
jgi:hypothetical protein